MRPCFVCGVETAKLCGACKQVAYCAETCQSADRIAHIEECDIGAASQRLPLHDILRRHLNLSQCYLQSIWRDGVGSDAAETLGSRWMAQTKEFVDLFPDQMQATVSQLFRQRVQALRNYMDEAMAGKGVWEDSSTQALIEFWSTPSQGPTSVSPATAYKTAWTAHTTAVLAYVQSLASGRVEEYKENAKAAHEQLEELVRVLVGTS